MSEVTKEEMLEWLFQAWMGALKNTPKEYKICETILDLIEHGPEVDKEWIERWLDKNVPCDCHEAYTTRKMQDPNCFRHGHVDDIDWAIMLREAGVMVKETADEHAESL